VIAGSRISRSGVAVVLALSSSRARSSSRDSSAASFRKMLKAVVAFRGRGVFVADYEIDAA
jgi:hypothetical protein